MNYFTKCTVIAALPSFDTDAVADVMLFSNILRFGCSSKFLTNNEKNFVSEAMKVICHRLGIKKREKSIKHLQLDGLVERMNRTVKSSLSIYCQEDPRTWDIYKSTFRHFRNQYKQATLHRLFAL